MVRIPRHREVHFLLPVKRNADQLDAWAKPVRHLRHMMGMDKRESLAIKANLGLVALASVHMPAKVAVLISRKHTLVSCKGREGRHDGATVSHDHHMLLMLPCRLPQDGQDLRHR